MEIGNSDYVKRFFRSLLDISEDSIDELVNILIDTYVKNKQKTYDEKEFVITFYVLLSYDLEMRPSNMADTRNILLKPKRIEIIFNPSDRNIRVESNQVLLRFRLNIYNLMQEYMKEEHNDR